MSSLPDWLEPMAATLTQDRFTGPEWIFERKYDGIRLLAYRQGGDVRLFSRNRLPKQIPKVAAAVAGLPGRDLILDGEVSWSSPYSYHLFDVLWHDGRSLTALPLVERRRVLRQLPLRAPLHRVTALRQATPWEHACSHGWEGVVAKRRDSRYEHRRSRSWLKMKCEANQELVVGGFTEPQGSRVGLGALLLGHFDGAGLRYAGRVGTGLDNRTLLDLRARLDALEVADPPFVGAVGLPRKRAHWVRPQIVVQVAFIQWTENGKLRHPRLLAIRDDKAARAVVRERR